MKPSPLMILPHKQRQLHQGPSPEQTLAVMPLQPTKHKWDVSFNRIPLKKQSSHTENNAQLSKIPHHILTCAWYCSRMTCPGNSGSGILENLLMISCNERYALLLNELERKLFKILIFSVPLWRNSHQGLPGRPISACRCRRWLRWTPSWLIQTNVAPGNRL